MKMIHGGLFATLLASLLLTGCIGQQTIHSQALGPTEAEAKELAKAQLDEQAVGHKAMTSVHYSTKTLPQSGSADIYQVTASERIK
jgi:hypothetical protein